MLFYVVCNLAALPSEKVRHDLERVNEMSVVGTMEVIFSSKGQEGRHSLKEQINCL